MNEGIIIIFGASGDIGSALAKLISKNHKLVALCSRDEEKLKKLSKNLHQPYFVVDGTKEQDVINTCNLIENQYGKIKGVVNCIGSFFIKPLINTSAAEVQKIFEIHFLSSFYILKAVLDKMNKHSEGSCVLISSVAAKIGLVHHEIIGAAKGAIEAFVKNCAATYAKKGIRVNAVAPGLIDTKLSEPLTHNESMLKNSVAFHPLGRIGSKEEVASLIYWLLSDDSRFITGETISIDGGLSSIKLSANK